MVKAILNKPLNSGKPLTDNAEGNPERSLANDCKERATTIPIGSRSKRTEAGAAQTSKVVGNDIVSTCVERHSSYTVCNKCRKPKVLPDDFYGANRVCKDCIKARAVKWQRSPEGKKSHNKANREWGKTASGRKSKATYKKTDKGKVANRQYLRGLRKREPLKTRARALVNTHVRRGKLQKPECCERCGEKLPLQGHHVDYSKPLEVEWLCYECHRVADAEVANCIEGIGRL